MQGYDLIAAVDLGSNSFRLLIGRTLGMQVYPLDALKESVRLAAGLDASNCLDAAARERALVALRRFAERLKGFAPGAVRAVATNTFRVASNGAEFLREAEAALGFSIEIIAGREEARLIYLGVAHAHQEPGVRQLVVDIGGGSTECVIGENGTPMLLESLYMGCVGYTLKFFGKDRISKSGYKAAEGAAMQELQSVLAACQALGWQKVIGTSGTAKAIAELLHCNGWNDELRSVSGLITRAGLERLRDHLIRAGSVARLKLEGLRSDRSAVLPGGLAILLAVFKVFDLERMEYSDGALRQGVLYDLLGRQQNDDMREMTVNLFMQRYGVDRRQAARVSQTAQGLWSQLPHDSGAEARPDWDRLELYLVWAARLHEIGMSIGHTSYQKHSAYILEHADMPGFSQPEQQRLARLVMGHRGKLERLKELRLEAEDWPLILCLRLAVVLRRARRDVALPAMQLSVQGAEYCLRLPQSWLSLVPLTELSLQDEVAQWASCGFGLHLEIQAEASSQDLLPAGSAVVNSRSSAAAPGQRAQEAGID